MAAREQEFTFVVKVKTKRVEGPSSEDDMVAEDIRMHLEDDSNPGDVFPGDSQHEITSWTVTQQF